MTTSEEPKASTREERWKLSTPWAKFHHLWTKAASKHDYVKAEWVEIEQFIPGPDDVGPVPPATGPAPTKVLLIESFDLVEGIVTTPEAARAWLIGTYSHPYKVEWQEIKPDGDGWTMSGDFHYVEGHSVEQTREFYIRPYGVWGNR